MIELKIEGVCKECPFRSLYLNQFDDTVNCKHVMVCKYISYPQGEEALEAATKLIFKSVEEGLRAASEKGTDA